jgi:pimeloyl-ACP methyl ester carboxylesterase
MSTYVLIHGAWHGAWCWKKVIPLIEKEGHNVVTPDLPGHGEDKRPIAEITLQAYTDRVCEILDEQSDPVILVGHSMGGVVITQTAEYRPEKIKKLIYLAGFLLQNGESLRQHGKTDTESLALPNLIMSEDESYSNVKEEALKEVFYADCSDEDVEFAKSRLVPQSVAPFVTPVSTTEKYFGRVARVYISCLRDKTISPSIQEKMYKALPCGKVISMDTSHSPFFSAPDELANHLLSI